MIDKAQEVFQVESTLECLGEVTVESYKSDDNHVSDKIIGEDRIRRNNIKQAPDTDDDKPEHWKC